MLKEMKEGGHFKTFTIKDSSRAQVLIELFYFVSRWMDLHNKDAKLSLPLYEFVFNRGLLQLNNP